MSKKTQKLVITILAVVLAICMVAPLVMEMIPIKQQSVTLEPGTYTSDENGNLVKTGDIDPDGDDIVTEWDEDTEEQQTTEK